MRTEGTSPLHQAILDVFENHDPLMAPCLSVYRKITEDLLRYWRYADTPHDVQTYITALFVLHGNRTMMPSQELVTDVYACRRKAV